MGLGLYFLAVGATHFIVPDGLPETLAWMYDVSDSAHYVAGTAEILGGIGLILPGLTRIRPDLTVWAAAGLIVIMVLAFGWHVTRSEYPNMVFNAILAGSLGFVAYGRWRLHPIPSRGEVAA